MTELILSFVSASLLVAVCTLLVKYWKLKQGVRSLIQKIDDYGKI